MICHLRVFTGWKRTEIMVRKAWRNTMRHGTLVAAVAMLTMIGAAALAETPTPLDPVMQIAQAAFSPPAPQPEFPLAPPASTYVWQPGHWWWNGVQYVWESGQYVERPSATATYVAGHWEQGPNGWVWLAGHWVYESAGSSTPPVR
jgi:hypothetical protein